MALTKRTYTDGETIITAGNLNAIQDEIIANATGIAAKQAKITASGLLKGNGSGTVSAAVAGTDYLTPSGAASLPAAQAVTGAQITGSVATFSAAVADMPLKSLLIKIEPLQSGSGDPSPTNHRPISNRTGCNFYVSPTTNAQDGSTYSVTFPTAAGTVYGCTLDVVNKKLTVEWASTTLQMFASNWGYTDGTKQFYATSVTLKPSEVRTMVVYCDRYRCLSNGEAFDSSLDNVIYTGTVNGVGRLYVQDLDYTSVESFLAAMGDAQIVYQLATPIVIDLPNVPEITTLLGENNIWSDSGDVEVTYGAYLETVKAHSDDLSYSIFDAIAPRETSYTASRAYSVGSYLFVGMTFYRVTANIASGGVITPGTNAVQTTLADAMIEALMIQILVQPEDITVHPNTEATWTILANKSNVAYQWQYYYNNQWSNFQGGTAASLTKTVQSSWNGWKIRCIVKDANNSNNYVVSEEKTLTVSST